MYCPQLIDNPMHPQFHLSLGWNMGEEAFNNASLRVLFVFPSGMGVRVVSATHQALYNIVKEKYGDDVFVDICMLPVDSYKNKYFKHFPAIAGYFSKHTIEDFEVIGCSVAITMTEVVELPIFLNRAGFNVDHKSRMADDKAPLLVVGGVAADGQSYLDSVVDLVMLGAGERTIPFLLDKVFEGQSRYGTVGKAKEWIIGACTGVKGFYNPHVYNYKHDVVDGKWQSEYLGCDIPDLGIPHHDNDLPAEVIRVNDRQLRLPLPGAEQHKLSLQSSFGCGGAASQCTFCKEGWDYGCYASHTPVFTKRGMLQIKDVQVGDEVLTHKGRFRKVTRLWRHGLKEFVPVTLMGEEIHTTLSHKWYTSDSDSTPEFKPIESNPESFKVYLPLLPKGSTSVDKGIAFLTGLYLSDGNLVHRVDNDTFDGLTISGHSDHVDLYLNIFKDLGLPEPTVSHNTDKSAVTYYFSNSHNLHTAILQYVVPADTKTGQEKDLLDCVLDWDDESAHYLILGYFFGDGAIKQPAWASPRDHQYNVSLPGACSSLMNKLHLLCNRFYTTKLLVYEFAPIRKDMFVIRFDTYSTVKFLHFAGDLALVKSEKVHPYFLSQDLNLFAQRPYGAHTDYGIAKEVRKSRSFHYDLAYTDESYDLEVEEDHSYTVGYNKFIVSNSWRERDDEDLYAGVRKAKATSFADGMSFFSFNSSFRSNYVGDLEYAAKYFNNLTALNFRLDSIAGSILHDPENNIARLVRFLGATTFASPVEGVSQRLRNWLNKNLTEEDILIVVNEVFKNRYTRYKMGVIWTGYETKDDFEECYDLLRRMVDIRDTSGGNTQITFNCCLEASTLVNTTRGLVRADEVVSGDYVLNNGEPKKVLSTCITPVQSGYKITTKRGYSIEVNGEHPFQTVQKVSGGRRYWEDGVYKREPDEYIDASFVKAQDLMVGDKVRLAPLNKFDIPNHQIALSKYNVDDNRVVELDSDLAECLGWITGDGCLMQAKYPSCNSERFRAVAVLNEKEYSLSSQAIKRSLDKNKFSYHEHSSKGVHYLYADTTFSKLAIDLFGGAKKSSEKSVPSLILQSSLDVQAGFLRGLFSADGYCASGRQKTGINRGITLVTVSPSLAKTVQIMLLNFGIKSKIETQEQSTSRLSSGRLIVSKHKRFNLRIFGNNFVTFVNEIGFNNQKQEKALASVGNSWHERHWSLYGFDTIVSIERTSEKQYYGHEVEGHVYETDGFVTHNTSLVHSWGTPLYYVPRKSTYLQWLNHFSKIDNKPFYYYPWMPVVDLGIKVNASSHPVDTIIQQALVDMPGEFLRECWLKPSLEGKMASRSAEQVRLLREGMERYGIDPKKQYLEYDPLKNPHQHMTPPYLVGAAKTVSGGDLTKYAEVCSKTERGLGSCLVTPATLEKNNLTKCLACGSCPGVDKTRKQFGLKSDLPHLKWMQTRNINVKYTFEDVKTTILVNKPSFYYTFVFKVPKSSKLIANELLVRRFFVHANTVEESLVDNFRNINYSFFNTVDYSGLTPNYHGYEVVQVGFRDRLDEDKFTAIWKQTNELMGGAIQLVKWFPSQESGSNNYLALYELDFNLSMEDFPKVVECLENEQWAWYEDIPVNPETFDLPFRYKVVKGKEGTKLFVLVRPRVNVGYSIGLRLWTYPTIHHRLSDQKIRAVFQESNGQLIDVVTGKVFDVSGFKQVDKGDSSIAAKVYEPEIGGA